MDEKVQEAQPEKRGFFGNLLGGAVKILSLPGRAIDAVDPLPEIAERLAIEEQIKKEAGKPGIIPGALSSAATIASEAARGAIDGGIVGAPEVAAVSAAHTLKDEIVEEIRDPERMISKLSEKGYGSKEALRAEYEEFSYQPIQKSFAQTAMNMNLVASEKLWLLNQNPSGDFKRMKENGGSMNEFEELKRSGLFDMTEYMQFRKEVSKLPQEQQESVKGGLKETLRLEGIAGEYLDSFKEGTAKEYIQSLKDYKQREKVESAAAGLEGIKIQEVAVTEIPKHNAPNAASQSANITPRLA